MSTCCASCHKTRGLATSDNCQCGKRQTMFHIINSCPQTTLEADLPQLHLAPTDHAGVWPTTASLGSHRRSWRLTYHSFTWLPQTTLEGGLPQLHLAPTDHAGGWSTNSFTWLKIPLFHGWCHMAHNAHDNNNITRVSDRAVPTRGNILFAQIRIIGAMCTLVAWHSGRMSVLASELSCPTLRPLMWVNHPLQGHPLSLFIFSRSIDE